jgi:hypothetical protein
VSEEFDVAKAFYFQMLEREIVAAKQPDAVPLLHATARLRSLSERLVPGSTDPLKGSSPPRVELSLALAHRLTEYDIRVDGETGELISWYLDFLAVEGDESTPPDEAVGVATRTAHPPPDTKISHSAYETMGGRTVFRVRWSHEHEGLLVEDDFIEVLVNGKARLPFSMTWRYHTPKIAPGPRP